MIGSIPAYSSNNLFQLFLPVTFPDDRKIEQAITFEKNCQPNRPLTEASLSPIFLGAIQSFPALDGRPELVRGRCPELVGAPAEPSCRHPHEPAARTYAVVVVAGFSSPEAVYPPVDARESMLATDTSAPR